MENFTISFKDEKGLKEYVVSRFAEAGIKTKEEESGKNRTCLSLLCERETFHTVLAEILSVYYKAKTLLSCFEEEGDVLFYAYLGAVVCDDHVTERKGIRDYLPVERDVNLDGIFRFLLWQYDQFWRELGKSMKKLYDACESDEDVITLVKYFLANGKMTKRTLIVDTTVYYDDNNEDIPFLKITDDKEKNVAFNLLVRRPQEIVIPFPKKYSEELVSLIQKLGE